MLKFNSLPLLALCLCVSAQAGEAPLSRPDDASSNAEESLQKPSDSGWSQESGWTGGLAGEPRQTSIPVGETPVVSPASSGPGFQWNGIEARLRARYSAVYDDNIFISNSDEESDIMHTISPGFILGAGDSGERAHTFASLEYIPSFILFQENSDLNSVDQHVRLDGQWAGGRLTTGGRFQYEKLSGAEREISDRVDRDIYTAALEAAYRVSDKTSVDVDGVVWLRDYERHIDSREFVNHNWFNYHFTPKVNVAIGAAFGVLDPDRSGCQTYQQGLVRLRYDSTAKLTFNGHAGGEFRQFDDSSVDHRATPVFGLGSAYRVSEGTSVGINASRRVVSSATRPGENYTATRVSLRLSQHIWSDLFLDVDGGYEHDDYNRASMLGVGQREDDFYYVRPGVRWHLNDWARLSAFYLYRENDANQLAESFRNNQCGVELALGF